MTWLGVDAGNTNTKFYLLDGEKPERITGEKIPWETISRIGIVQTGQLPEKLQEKLESFKGEIIRIDSTLNLPFKNAYQSPSLGADRIALCAGGITLYGNNLLIVDTGTCITYDFIDQEGKYSGGAISPGIYMRYRALHDYTAGLPLLSIPGTKPPITGNTTETSIHSGVLNGILFELEGAIQQYQAQYPGIKVVLTGGDAHFLYESLKFKIFAINQDLLAIGIKKMLEINQFK